MKSMSVKVVLDATPFFGFPHPRGIGTYLINLSRELSNLTDLFFAFKIERITRPESRRRLKKLGEISSVTFIIGDSFLFPPKKRYIFHGTDLFLLKSAPKKVLTLHDLYYFKDNIEDLSLEYVEKKKSIIKRLLTEYNPDAVITPSFFVKNEVLSLFPHLEGRVQAVHHGVSPIFRPKRPETVKERLTGLNLTYKEYLLFVGFADGRKNLKNLLRAVDSLDVKLVLTGTPLDYLKAHYPASERLVAGGKLKVYTRLYEEGLVDLYSGAIALVFPSIYEGFGLPVLEAMATGTPAIVSRIDTFKEICEDAVLYCDPQDPNDIRDKIVKITSDSELRDKLREKGLNLIKKYTWERTAYETLRVYESIS